jgi:carbamate kinase
MVGHQSLSFFLEKVDNNDKVINDDIFYGGSLHMRIVLALGGNALLERGKKGTFEDQQQAAAVAMRQLVQLVKEGNHLIVTHGNGPQCGAIFLQNVNSEPAIPAMPLHVCGAMSQGFLGEMIQQELDAALRQ